MFALIILCFFYAFCVHAAPVNVIRGSNRYEFQQFTSQGVYYRYKDFLTFPSGSNLYLRVEEVYRPRFDIPFSPANCDVYSEHTWYHKNPDGTLICDYAIHAHIYTSMPTNQHWWYENNQSSVLMRLPYPNIWQKFFFGNGYTEDFYSLCALSLNNGLNEPALFTLEYMLDQDFPNLDIPCRTRYVVPAYSSRVVAPSFNNCFLYGIEDSTLNITSGKVNWAGAHVEARSANNLARADVCPDANFNPPPIPTMDQVRKYLEFFFENPGL